MKFIMLSVVLIVCGVVSISSQSPGLTLSTVKNVDLVAPSEFEERIQSAPVVNVLSGRTFQIQFERPPDIPQANAWIASVYRPSPVASGVWVRVDVEQINSATASRWCLVVWANIPVLEKQEVKRQREASQKVWRALEYARSESGPEWTTLVFRDPTSGTQHPELRIRLSEMK